MSDPCEHWWAGGGSNSLPSDYENRKGLPSQFRLMPAQVRPLCLQGNSAGALPARSSVSPLFSCRVERIAMPETGLPGPFGESFLTEGRGTASGAPKKGRPRVWSTRAGHPVADDVADPKGRNDRYSDRSQDMTALSLRPFWQFCSAPRLPGWDQQTRS